VVAGEEDGQVVVGEEEGVLLGLTVGTTQIT